MNFDDYWQENRGFVGQVAAGLVAFLILAALIDGTVGDAVTAARRARGTERDKLSQPAFSGADLELARADHQALRSSLAQLAEAVHFAPDPQLREPGQPVTSERYLEAVARVRNELLPLANRANVQLLDQTFGLPELSPTREDELERTLEGLDLVARVLRLAIEERVSAVRTVRIRLDTRLGSRDGPGALERTRVQFDLHGHNRALARLVQRAQGEFDPPLVLESLEIEGQRGSDEQVRLQAVWLAPRLSAELLELRAAGAGLGEEAAL
jgi:hypothetical protein